MFFEIKSGNTIFEIDDLLDIIDLIKVDGKRIVGNKKVLAEYDTAERANEVFEELCNTFEEGVEDFYTLPKE